MVLLSHSHRTSPQHRFLSVERREDWAAYGGTWEAVDGAMRNNSDERGAKLMTGSTNWENYSVEADIQLLGQYGDAGLILRARNEEEGVDAYNGYFAGLRDLDNTLILGRADFGWREYLAKPISPRVKAEQWYHLKFLVYGCDFVARATSLGGETTTTAMREANCLTSGRVGLKSYATGAMWRNIEIRPATRADEVAMIGETPPLPAVAASEVAGAVLETYDRYFQPLYLDMQDHESDPNAVPISSLRLLSPITPTKVTVHGVVTLTSPVLYIQDSGGGLAIEPEDARMPLEIGDEVEAHGDLIPGDFSSVLKHASVHVMWSRMPVPPVSVTASQASSGSFDATFVEIDGQLEKKEQGPNHTIVMTLNDGNQSFRAMVSDKNHGAFPWTLKEKSRLQLHGICTVDPAYTQNETPFAIILPSIDDIQMIKGPPWWSAGHIIAAAIALLVLIVAAQAIHGRIRTLRLQAILEERERMAHEMHDTLAQSFAGIGFQLQAIRDEVGHDGNEDELREHLDLANELVRTSHDEARRSISALRSETLEQQGLLKALDGCAGRMVNGGSIRVRCESEGDPRTIPLRISDALFRIGQEAVANAVRHANPTELKILVLYERAGVALTVQDNGRGFPMDEDSANFGIRGMGKRAERIGAALEINSSAAQGTRVHVRAPLPKGIVPKSWRYYANRIW
jgi:two-component sensor histidine kinase